MRYSDELTYFRLFVFSYLLEIITILCVQNGTTALLNTLDDLIDEFARLLIEKGANLDIQDEVF